MATNPMQRKSRNAFLLGVVITLLIAAVIVVLLYMKIQEQQEEIDEYQVTTSQVYILNQDVVSGQVLTSDMFTKSSVPTTTIPSDSTTDVYTTLNSYSLSDTEGRSIYYDSATMTYYYFVDENGNNTLDQDTEKRTIYSRSGDSLTAQSALTTGETYYFYAGTSSNSDLTEVTISTNAVIAKVDMKSNTVITSSLITRADERTTDDLRETEYNIISLPIDLITGDYVDIRLVLPSGEDYIVVSKKQVTVPVSNGAYVEDTIQMNLTEKEILYLSCAIVENYTIEGSKLYATKYTEAGIQEAATVTYYPSDDIINLISGDDNILDKAIEGIKDRRSSINDALNDGDTDNIASEVEDSISATLDERKSYLQSLTPTE